MKNQKITSVTIILAFSCLACLPLARAVSTPPDGCYPGFTTAEGCNALQHLTSGAANTGLGWRSLFSNSTGSFNTGVGAGALILNNGSNNTALGAAALLNNTTGSNNTALGASAGTDPDIGSNNVYIGDPGFPGDTNVISIGAIAASGIDYQATFIGGIYGASVNNGTALTVYVDTDGQLGTSLVNANGQKVRIRSPKGGKPQAKLNEFQKQEQRIADLESTVARLAATVKDQAAQIEKVNAQLEKAALQLIVDEL